jgi:hypothetical protein
VTQVLDRGFEPIQASHIAALFFSLLDVSHRPEREITRLVGRFPGSNLLVDLPLQVVTHFFIQFVLNRTAEKERSKSKAKNA